MFALNICLRDNSTITFDDSVTEQARAAKFIGDQVLILRLTMALHSSLWSCRVEPKADNHSAAKLTGDKVLVLRLTMTLH